MFEIMSIDAFKNTKALSYSRLSKLADGPRAYKQGLEDTPESSALALGSAVDLMLTDPESLHREIYIMSTDKPGSDMMTAFCEVYAETGDRKKAHAASGFKINLERTMAKFDIEGKMYFDALVASKDKKILDMEGYMTATALVKALTTNEFTKEYLLVDEDNKDIELFFQVPIVWSTIYKSLVSGKNIQVWIKSLLDVLYINHRKSIIIPIELKTGADSFMKSFWRFKRYLQGGMYYEATSQLVSSDREMAQRYSVEPTKFIYADTNLVYPPIVYNMNREDIIISRQGLKNNTDETKWKLKGYEQLLKELEWHEKNDKWDYSYDVYANNGEIDIDINSRFNG